MRKLHGKCPGFKLTLRRCFMVFVILAIVGFIALQGLIISGSRTEDAEVDCLIILGAGINGEYPSSVLKSRLDNALEFLDSRADIPIIVSGGLGQGEAITEAEAMYRYLRRSGADSKQIWKEEESTSTWENLAFSMAVMEEKGLDAENATIAIVTNEFHLYRAKHIAGTLGLEAIGVAAETPSPRSLVYYHIREAAALLKSFLMETVRVHDFPVAL